MSFIHGIIGTKEEFDYDIIHPTLYNSSKQIYLMHPNQFHLLHLSKSSTHVLCTPIQTPPISTPCTLCTPIQTRQHVQVTCHSPTHLIRMLPIQSHPSYLPTIPPPPFIRHHIRPPRLLYNFHYNHVIDYNPPYHKTSALYRFTSKHHTTILGSKPSATTLSCSSFSAA